MRQLGTIRRSLIAGLIATLSNSLPGDATAAGDYPAKPITMIVPYGAGGGTDTMGRVFAKALGDELGQPVVVVNRKGGGGAVGASFLKAADTDGYTFLMGGIDEIAAWIANSREVDFDKDDFRYLGSVANYQNALVAPTKQPFSSLTAFVEHAKANPGTPVVSQGGMDRLFLTMLADKEGLDLKMVPTSGGAEAMQMLLAGNAVLSYSGGVHANYEGTIAVMASLNGTRLSGAPDAMTFVEAGYNLTMPSLIGFMAPAGLPDDIAATLEAAILKAGASEDFKIIVEERLKSQVDLVSAADTTSFVMALEQTLRPLAQK